MRNASTYITGAILALTLVLPVSSFAQETSGSATTDGTKPLPPKPALMRGQHDGTMGSSTKPSIPKVMMASGTRPLPGGLKNMMQERDQERDSMMQNGNMPGQRNGTTSAGLPGKMGERMDAAKERMAENRINQLKDLAKRTTTRIGAAIDRLVKLIDRVNSRIAKMKAEGIDTSAAEKHIANAQAAIEKAKVLLSEAQSAANNATSTTSTATTTPRDGKPGIGNSPIKEAFNKAGEPLKTADKEIKEALKSLRDVMPKNGTTTPGLREGQMKIKGGTSTQEATGGHPDGQ